MSKSEPNLDYKLDGPEPYKWADVKQPIEPDSRPNSSLERQTSEIGESILKQKTGAKDVLHVVDLKDIPPESKALFEQKVLDVTKSSEGIVFINK